MDLKRITAVLVLASLVLPVVTSCGSGTPKQPATSAQADTGSSSADADWSSLSNGRRAAMELDDGGTITLVSNEKFDLKYAHVSTLSAPYHVAAEFFSQLLENRTNGNIKVTVHGASTLGNVTEIIEGLQMNTIDFASNGHGPLINFVPDIGLIDIPYLFEGFNHAYAVLDGPVGRGVLDALEPSGIVGLEFFEGYFSTIHTNKPINSFDDWKGLKIRTAENQSYMAFITNLGANPIPMAWSETYTALDNGTVDGVATDLPFYTQANMYIPAPYTTLTMHNYSSAPLLMSKATWDKMPEDYQQIIKECAVLARDWQRWFNAYYTETDVEKAKAAGGVFISPAGAELEPYLEAGLKVQDMYVPTKFSQETIDSIKNTSWTLDLPINWFDVPEWWTD